MKKIFFLLTSLLCGFFYIANAQNLTFTVPSGQKIIDVVPDSILYHAKSFVKGRVVMKNGATGISTINYSWILKEMMYVNEKKDTVAISDPSLYEYFAVAEDTFYYNVKSASYLQKVGNYGSHTLYEGKDLRMANVKKIGPLGTNAAINSERIEMTEAPTNYMKLTAKEDIVLSLIPEYYLRSKNGDFVKILNKKSIKKNLSNKELTAFNNYTKFTNVNPDNKNDLTKMFENITQSL